MRIGVVAETRPDAGGIFQYSNTLVRALARVCTDDDLFVFHGKGVSVPTELDGLRLNLVPISRRRGPIGSIRYTAARHLPTPAKNRLRRWARNAENSGDKDRFMAGVANIGPDFMVKSWFAGFDLDLMFYPTGDELSFHLGIPYVVAIHDLQHRLQPEFPEVSADGEWERREYMLSRCIKHAALVLADSEVGREDVLNFYGELGVTAGRVKVLPFRPAGQLERRAGKADEARVRARHNLTQPYAFYPAQFWPHKNHLTLVKAISLLVTQGVDIALVLVGSYSGTLREQHFARVMHCASELGVADRVRHLGYVPDEDMAGLYRGAIALVMPTFFGPTNIPPLEAFSVGCPVITSDIRGVREQVDDAGLLADPRSPDAIADAVRRLLDEPGLADELRSRGRARLASFTWDDYCVLLGEILGEAKQCVTRGDTDTDQS